MNSKDFSSVSPSAKWLLMIKGYTNIPYTREVAELLVYPEKYEPDFKRRDFSFWAITLHFENRYWSIDQMMKDLSVKNYLELSSGYSFRSMYYARQEGIYFIDTDLPEIIDIKKTFIDRLQNMGYETRGKLELLPLNVLDKEKFLETIGHFPKGEVVIVNEGLLTYLDKQEKEQLCSTIREILAERGGYWITADVYIKNKQPRLGFQYDDKITDFRRSHNTEDNSFENFNNAKTFFQSMGFMVEKEARISYREMSSFKYFMKSLSLRQLIRLKSIGRIQATWRLKAL